MTDLEWHREMWRLVPVEGYAYIPRLAYACAYTRPFNGWVDARADYPLRAPLRRPLPLEVYLPRRWAAGVYPVRHMPAQRP
jgi:hypothetical protein